MPSLVLKARLGLAAWDIAGVVFAFILLELLLSRLLFGLHLRDRPYYRDTWPTTESTEAS